MSGHRRPGASMEAEPWDALRPMLESLARPGRLALFRCVLRAGSEGISRDRLIRRLGTTGSALTFHLRALAEAGLIQTRITPGDEGEERTVHCVANPDVLARAVALLLSEGTAPVGLDGPGAAGSSPPADAGPTERQPD